ncbi:MAG TPA: CoA pyrophosphatase [Longimicrobiaceae bacterium]|jgi:8-oxo-dGTP pyrophosphatase MutT (NUDIX family)|nr:CoA pyrophosphatase [Longimicrobiaceae bacterium]
MSAASPDPLTDPRVAALGETLGERRASEAPDSDASVALLVRPARIALELLVIQRSERVGDPWSGHMAFPGGRRDAGDADPLATAVRETREEVGIDIAAVGRLLGPLDAVRPGGGPQLVVSPFAFAVPAGTLAQPNYEVRAALWIPVRDLIDPEAAREYLHQVGAGTPRRFPALTWGEYTIWGLTHRILSQFLESAAVGMQPGERR